MKQHMSRWPASRAYAMADLLTFVRESNRIEGIERQPVDYELEAHASFLALNTVKVADLEGFVVDIVGVPLRRAKGQNVRVGSHFPPPGGPNIELHLEDLLIGVNNGNLSPWQTHVRYESLHPFMDGNGRSGRVLWLWQMIRDEGNVAAFGLPFLHRVYYQALDGAR